MSHEQEEMMIGSGAEECDARSGIELEIEWPPRMLSKRVVETLLAPEGSVDYFKAGLLMCARALAGTSGFFLELGAHRGVPLDETLQRAMKGIDVQSSAYPKREDVVIRPRIGNELPQKPEAFLSMRKALPASGTHQLSSEKKRMIREAEEEYHGYIDTAE
jgi:hypothetical protein